MTGLIIPGMIVVYIIDFYLKGLLVKTISLVKSGCPYSALHPIFTKRTHGTTLVSLHNNPDWPWDIFRHKVNVFCADGQGTNPLPELNRLLPNGLFHDPSLVKRQLHCVFGKRTCVCICQIFIWRQGFPVFDVSAFVTLQPCSVCRPRHHIPDCLRHTGNFIKLYLRLQFIFSPAIIAEVLRRRVARLIRRLSGYLAPSLRPDVVYRDNDGVDSRVWRGSFLKGCHYLTGGIESAV